MHDEQFKKIRETAWRRPLTRDEQAALQEFLQAHPAGRQDWAAEAALNQLLERLPAVAVSSNFTARVVAAAQSARPRSAWRDWFDVRFWLPETRVGRLAMCSMMLCAGVISFHEVQMAHRAQVARELADVSRVASLPPVEWLKDFDTINAINKVKVADDDLLAALR